MTTNLPAPGPKGHLLTGNLPEFSRDPLGFLTRSAREYGPLVRLRFSRLPAYLISEPEFIAEVLVTKQRNFIKARPLRASRRVFGNGLLTSEGDFWLHQRRLSQPAFHSERITAYGQVMVDHARRMLAGWREGETRDIHEDMKRLTLEIVTRTLFSDDVTGAARELGRSLEAVMERHAARRGWLRHLPEFVPTPANGRYRKAAQHLDATIYGIIGQRRASGEDTGDLLSMLLHARDEDGSGMTDSQLRDEVMSLFLGGYDTPALALSWVWYLLSQHPGAEDKLMTELQALSGENALSVADLPALPYTEAIVKESLRLYPPAWIIGREAVQECEIGGYRIPAGTTVLISQWVMHHDARFFESPDEFIPERWADGRAGKLPRYAYFPFGGGPRVCIGASFAMMEIVLVLATIAQQFRLELAPDCAVVPWPTLTLRPKHGVRVVLRKR